MEMRPGGFERLSYTVEQFMAASGFSRRKVYEAISSGKLRTIKNGKRRLISEGAAREFIRDLERETAKAEAA